MEWSLPPGLMSLSAREAVFEFVSNRKHPGRLLLVSAPSTKVLSKRDFGYRTGGETAMKMIKVDTGDLTAMPFISKGA